MVRETRSNCRGRFDRSLTLVDSQRRSKDGFVSATGMFKIAFPWAKAEEEKNEREYLKSREYTSQEEVAGNVWISPLFGRLI